MKFLSKLILIYIMRWKIVNDFPDLKKYIIIAAPHTSWQDFPIAIMSKFIKSTKVNYIGKASLFKPPFGFLFRWLGGSPVDRSKSNDRVQAIINLFDAHEEYILGMSPEGTRKKVEKWKTGFYYIAKGAKVPIAMATLDFKRKEIKISEPFYPTDDMEADFKYFHEYFDGVEGKKPDLV